MDIQKHFSCIAGRYRALRTTDAEPIAFIRRHLPRAKRIVAADVGCGAGRYDLKLFEQLGNRLCLHCFDANKDMLRQLRAYLRRHRVKGFTARRARAERLPLADGSLDCAFTFNAVHHFKTAEFLREMVRVLRPGGRLFIYTRTRGQNERNVFGRFFPSFAAKETRLLEAEGFLRVLAAVPELALRQVRPFWYVRTASADSLLEKVKCRHYSTFALYSVREFQKATEEFIRNLGMAFEELGRISWVDRNVMFLIEKRANL